MSKPPIPDNEAERLNAVASYHLMGTLPEKDFDDIARIASEICNVPLSLVTLMGEDRQWFKGHFGTTLDQNLRDIAFCSYTIMEPDEPLIVTDLRLDERFQENPLVTGPEQVVFYAGVPLVNPEGYAVGTLCVIDQKPNKLNKNQLASLLALANTVAQLFELRRKVKRLEAATKKLENLNQEVSELSYVLSHDLKSPLNSIVSLLEVFKEENTSQLNKSGQELLEMLYESTVNLSNVTKSTIKYFKTTRSFSETEDQVNFHELMVQLLSILRPPNWVSISYPPNLPTISTSKVALQHILLNLLDNAIKYSDKELCKIEIRGSENDLAYLFEVIDNGPGIEAPHQAKVFQLFQTLGRTDRNGAKGTGIGLAIVKRMIEKLGGEINIILPPEGGTCFSFSILKNQV